MRITEAEMQRLGNEGFVRWLKAINDALVSEAEDGTRYETRPIVTINGQYSLSAVMRNPINRNRRTGNYAFIGDEQFTVKAVRADREVSQLGVRLSVTLECITAPAKGDISSVTIDLQDAMSKFDGLEPWLASIDTPAPAGQAAQREREAQPLPEPLPTEEDMANDERVGEW